MQSFRRTAYLLLFATALVAQEKPTLAVLDFDAFGISGPEVSALTNRLRTNMIQLGQYRIIERGMMEQVLLEQDFQLTGCTSDECAVEVGQLLGAQFMVAGSIGRVGNTWTVEMRIIDVETGAVTKSASYDTRGEIDLVTLPPKTGPSLKLGFAVKMMEARPCPESDTPQNRSSAC